MTSITVEHLNQAINLVSGKSLAEQEHIVASIHAHQPDLLTSVLAHSQNGVALEKIEVLLHILIVAWTAFECARIQLATITVDNLQTALDAYAKHVNSCEALDQQASQQAIRRYIETHPEKYLFSFAYRELTEAGFAKLESHTDQCLVLTGLTVINSMSEATREVG